QDAILQEGDTIAVPIATAIDPEESRLRRRATISPDSIQVNVVGEVPTPGALQLEPDSTLNQAILAAGGFNNRARRSTVQLIRLNDDGTVSRQTLEVDFAQGIAANNPTLENNDVVIVGRSGLASASDTLGQILAPLGNALSILQLPFRFLDIFR
ncbi:MAG: sugar transporter, partial [Microcoleus sp. SIO2G3]|nr:sugar transporter [Microcoleus sp. SIO2G3]